MRHTPRRFIMSRFPAFCLGVALAILSAHPALAGQTVIINTDVTDPIYGNGDGPNGTDLGNDNDLLPPDNNTVIVNGNGMVDSDVRGGHIETISSSNTASYNSATVNGGTVNGSVAGGYAWSAPMFTATASYNHVTINGGNIAGNVFGGQAYNGSVDTATHNTVSISGSPVFDGITKLFGGDIDGTGDAFTGNTLNVWNYTGSTVADVQNFQNYNFVLPVSLTGLTVTDTAYLNDQGSRGSTVTGVSVVGGTAPVQPGESVDLITGTIDNSYFTQATARGKHGATLLYDWTLNATTSELTATLKSIHLNPQTKALSEGFLSGLALLNQGGDLVAGQGMGSAVGVGGSGWGTFAALSGGWSRYTTGSHADMGSVSLMTGLAKGADTSAGRLTLGAFIEFGNGVYNTHNSFSNTAPVDGDGCARHLGGGVLGRMDFTNFGLGRFYAEASARAGGIRNEYHVSGLRDGMGRSARGYDSSSAYYGLHLGTGYVWNITEKTSLDINGKYFWTRQQGDSVTLATNDPVSFESADSHRLRLGVRFAYATNKCVSPYMGAAYEHEFDGEARAETYGYSIGVPALRGGTGMAEIGVALKPSRSLPLSLDLGVRGYAGKRRGVLGAFRVKFDF